MALLEKEIFNLYSNIRYRNCVNSFSPNEPPTTRTRNGKPYLKDFLLNNLDNVPPNDKLLILGYVHLWDVVTFLFTDKKFI